jgi:Flp pilus assembly protein TadB
MAQRSPYNDRYKTDQKGKTRRSASSSKPKRAVADLTPAQVAKASKKKQSVWSRAKSAGSSGGSSSAAVPRVESTPRMRELRRIWWWLWGGALAVAVVILVMQQLKIGNAVLIGGAWLIWLVSMGGAFYIEFVPIRKERNLAIEAMKSGGKGSKPTSSSQDGPS